MAELSDEQKAMLEFETSWWKYAGAKDAEIYNRFKLTQTIYYARLNHIIDLPAAEAHAPTLVRRLRRLRDARKAQRSARARLS